MKNITQTTYQTGIQAIAMTRVSLEKQVEGYSLEAQSERLRQLEEKEKFEVVFTIEDDGYSGADFDRPSIKQALKILREGGANAVVFTSVDRFARDVEGGLALVSTFMKAGAKVLLGHLGWVQDTGWYRIQMNILLAVAQYQKDDIQEKSKGGVDRKIARGLAHGGSSPFGYRFVTGLELAAKAMAAGLPVSSRPQNTHEPVPADLATVTLMGDLALEGRSLQGICQELTVRGIKPPKGKQWRAYTVSKTLANPCYYTGIWHYGKTLRIEPKVRRQGSKRNVSRVTKVARPQSEWKAQELPGGPIMTESRWLAIQEARAKVKKTQVGRPTMDGVVPMLKGIVTCRCGKAVITRNLRNSGKCWRYYVCCNRDRLTMKYVCPYTKLAPAQPLEDACWNELTDVLEHKLPALIAQYNSDLQADVDGSGIDSLEEKASWYKKKISDIAVRAVMEDDAVIKQALQTKEKELKAEQALLLRRIDLVRSADATAKVDYAILRRAKDMRSIKNPQHRQDIFQTLVGSVVYADQEAEMTLRVPVAAFNSQHGVAGVDNFISLKTRVLVA